jgi:histone deacetylase 1/2/histone deacetylase 8
VFADLADYISLVAAATSTACRLLRTGEADVAIHWDGGRHHGMRNKASGFCYVADIVLGIMLLCKEGRPSISKSKRPRVMYLDLDIHHGDGVARAFTSPTHFITDTERPPQVLTLSVHYSSSVFYPAPTPLPTPDTLHPFTLAMPLAAYPSPSTYHRVYQDCVLPIKLAFDPDYIVLQLGADGLPEDPIGQWGAWSVDGDGGMAWYAEQVRAWGVPVCILGGGGYNHPNTARAWSSVTAHMVRRSCISGLADSRSAKRCLKTYRIISTFHSMLPRTRQTFPGVSPAG